MAAHLSAEQVRLALRLRARGLTLAEVGRQVCRSLRKVDQLETCGRRREPRPLGWEPRAGAADGSGPCGDQPGAGRRAVVHGDRRAAGAGVLDGVAGGRRERGRVGYRAWRAHVRAWEQARPAQGAQAR